MNILVGPSRRCRNVFQSLLSPSKASIAAFSSTSNQEQKDWFTFLSKAHLMSEEEVALTIKTEAVRKAFDRAKLSTLPPIISEAYKAEEKLYEDYSEIIEEKRQEGIIIGQNENKRSMALKLLKENVSEEIIMKCSEFTAEELAELKSSL